MLVRYPCMALALERRVFLGGLDRKVRYPRKPPRPMQGVPLTIFGRGCPDPLPFAPWPLTYRGTSLRGRPDP